jgi:hypothetical protein
MFDFLWMRMFSADNMFSQAVHSLCILTCMCVNSHGWQQQSCKQVLLYICCINLIVTFCAQTGNKQVQGWRNGSSVERGYSDGSCKVFPMVQYCVIVVFIFIFMLLCVYLWLLSLWICLHIWFTDMEIRYLLQMNCQMVRWWTNGNQCHVILWRHHLRHNHGTHSACEITKQS